MVCKMIRKMHRVQIWDWFCYMKESNLYMSVHDWLHHRQYGCSDGACMGDGLVSEGATTMILSVSERELVEGMDEQWMVSGRITNLRERDDT